MSKRASISSLLLLAVLALAALPARALPPSACQCSGGIDRDSRAIPASETYCGYKICGLNNVQWACTDAGWQNLGNCGSWPPECTQGVNQWGKPVHPNATFLNFTTCGVSFTQRFACTSSNQWLPTTPSCTFCELCRCYNGRDQNGNVIPAGSTSCGSVSLGVNSEKWQCTAGGWERYSTGGVPTNNNKFGINTASFIDTSRENADQVTAQTYRMGWYLMMIGNQSEETQIDFRIAAPIQSARNRNLTSILRLCAASGTCNYENHPERLVQILNNTFLRDTVTGPWFVIAGPNEPPTEKWMTTATKGMTAQCGTVYCSAQLDTIAEEMAIFANTVMTNMTAAHRQSAGGDIGLLSPAWDCHNPNTASLMAKFQQRLQNRGRSLSSFDGIAINAYNLHGMSATAYINNCRSWLQSATGTSNYNYYLTETGMLEADPLPVNGGNGDGVPPAVARDNFRELVKALRTDASIKAALFFNSSGRNGDPAFAYNVFTQSCEWQYVTGGHSQL